MNVVSIAGVRRPILGARRPIGLINPAAGSGAGFGTGSAGPGGVTATGVGIASASNGGIAAGSGNCAASSTLFGGFQATGNGQGFGVGK